MLIMLLWYIFTDPIVQASIEPLQNTKPDIVFATVGDEREFDCDQLFQGTRERFGYLVRYEKVDGTFDRMGFTTGLKYEVCGLSGGLYRVTVRTIDRKTCRVSVPTKPSLIFMQGMPDEEIEDSPYPNPFNPSVTIPYSVRTTAEVQVVIFGVNGDPVKVMNEGKKLPGRYLIVWRGDLQDGSPAPSGVYFCQVKVGDRIRLKKLVLLK